jgi:ATP-dependent Clp protease ATP-binding subunit ClpC
LAERQVLSIDASALAAHKRQGRPGDPPEASHLPFPNRPNTILCVEGLFDLAITGAGWGVMDALHFLEPLLSQGGLRCIATGTPFGFRQTLEKAGALAHHFEAIHVMPPSEEEATQVVLGLKDQYERFHGVLISDDAVTTAVRASGRFLLNRQLPDRALDLIDEAGARLKLRRESEPREIVELRRRIRQHTRNMESAIACHEFTKAREHAEAQSTDRENLMRLLEERKTKGEPDKTLTPQDIEEVIASRTGAPLAAVQAVMRQADSEEFARLAKELAAQVPVELREGVAFLATWLAACSSDDAERLASSIRSVKTKRTA